MFVINGKIIMFVINGKIIYNIWFSYYQKYKIQNDFEIRILCYNLIFLLGILCMNNMEINIIFL